MVVVLNLRLMTLLVQRDCVMIEFGEKVVQVLVVEIRLNAVMVQLMEMIVVCGDIKILSDCLRWSN